MTITDLVRRKLLHPKRLFCLCRFFCLKKQAADAAQILAAAVRTGVENEKAEKEKRRQERMARTPSKEDISSLLESVRAIKTVEDKQREEAEKQAGSTQANPAKENSDDNG